MANDIKIAVEHWAKINGLMRLINTLYSKAAPARIVGGAVRDTLRHVAFDDVDVATPLHPMLVMKKLEAANIKYIPTGLKHGTITAICNGTSVEVTTLRKDLKTDGRHAQVEFCDDWREDAMRRDFTVNALYADPFSGKIFDYFNGLEDLEKGRIKFIGNPADRIEEDHLRILRYFRFLARFDDTDIDRDSLAACQSLSKRQMTLARERISDELIKILAACNPHHAIKLAFEHDVFIPFLPEIEKHNIEELERLIASEQRYNIAPNALRRLAAILPRDIKVMDKIASRLKFSNVMRKSLLNLIRTQKVSANNIRKIAFKLGRESAIDQALLYSDDIAAALEKMNDWNVPKFECNGGALIQRGLPAGPIISQTLQEIREQWMDQNFPEGQALENIIDAAVNQNLALISSEAKNS